MFPFFCLGTYKQLKPFSLVVLTLNNFFVFFLAKSFVVSIIITKFVGSY